MTAEYPEHDKLRAVADASQAIGVFIAIVQALAAPAPVPS